MKRYIIKVTVLEGSEMGKTYLIQKGGKVAEEFTTATTYASRKNAEKQCKELQYSNDITRGIERNRAERHGATEFKFFSKSFRPVAVEII